MQVVLSLICSLLCYKFNDQEVDWFHCEKGRVEMAIMMMMMVMAVVVAVASAVAVVSGWKGGIGECSHRSVGREVAYS